MPLFQLRHHRIFHKYTHAICYHSHLNLGIITTYYWLQISLFNLNYRTPNAIYLFIYFIDEKSIARNVHKIRRPQELAFLKKTTKVCQRSLWRDGFQDSGTYLRRRLIQKQLTNIIIIRFDEKELGFFFNYWKKNCLPTIWYWEKNLINCLFYNFLIKNNVL